MDSNENQRNIPDKLLSTEVDAEKNMIIPTDKDNREEELLQEPRSDNFVKNIENPNGDNTLQAIENPNGHNNAEHITENPYGLKSSKNNVGDSNYKDKTSYRISDNKIKEQLEIATGAISQTHLKNANEKVEPELSNRGICRQRKTSSLISNEEPQDRRNTLWEKVERLSNIVNEETRSHCENKFQRAFQRNVHSPNHQVFEHLHQVREFGFSELESEYTHFRKLLARDQPFLEHIQINPSIEAERQRRLRYYSHRAAILNFALTQYRSLKIRQNIIMNVYYDASRQIRLAIIRLLRNMREQINVFQRYRRNQNDPPALDYSSDENERQFSLNDDYSAQDVFDALDQYRTMVGERILREHLHLRELSLRDRPFLDYMQINSSREAERRRRCRHYLNRERILSVIVARFCSINDRLNSITNNYDVGTRIPLALYRILDGLLDELAELSAENVRHDDELPALDCPDETLSFILPSYIISFLMGLVLFCASTNLSCNARQHFY